MVEVEIKKDPLLGTVEKFTIGEVDAYVEDFGTVLTTGDCSSGVCRIKREFVKLDATDEVCTTYGIDRDGYEEVCARLIDELIT